MSKSRRRQLVVAMMICIPQICLPSERLLLRKSRERSNSRSSDIEFPPGKLKGIRKASLELNDRSNATNTLNPKFKSKIQDITRYQWNLNEYERHPRHLIASKTGNSVDPNYIGPRRNRFQNDRDKTREKYTKPNRSDIDPDRGSKISKEKEDGAKSTNDLKNLTLSKMLEIKSDHTGVKLDEFENFAGQLQNEMVYDVTEHAESDQMKVEPQHTTGGKEESKSYINLDGSSNTIGYDQGHYTPSYTRSRWHSNSSEKFKSHKDSHKWHVYSHKYHKDQYKSHWHTHSQKSHKHKSKSKHSHSKSKSKGKKSKHYWKSHSHSHRSHYSHDSYYSHSQSHSSYYDFSFSYIPTTSPIPSAKPTTGPPTPPTTPKPTPSPTASPTKCVGKGCPRPPRPTGPDPPISAPTISTPAPRSPTPAPKQPTPAPKGPTPTLAPKAPTVPPTKCVGKGCDLTPRPRRFTSAPTPWIDFEELLTRDDSEDEDN